MFRKEHRGGRCHSPRGCRIRVAKCSERTSRPSTFGDEGKRRLERLSKCSLRNIAFMFLKEHWFERLWLRDGLTPCSRQSPTYDHGWDDIGASNGLFAPTFGSVRPLSNSRGAGYIRGGAPVNTIRLREFGMGNASDHTNFGNSL